MAFWDVDLTTQDGAEGAANLGGFACFIAAGLSVLGVAMAGGLLASGDQAVMLTTVGLGAAQVLIFVIAGFRLRAGKGAVWGTVAALLLVLEIAMKLITLTGLPGLVINLILLVGIINGIRGARALRGGALSPEEAAEVFR